MKTIRILAFFLWIGLWTGAAHSSPKTIPAPNPNGEKLEQFIADFMVWQKSESTGTIKNAKGYAAEAGNLSQWLKKLQLIPIAGLTPDQDVDCRLLASEIKTRIAEIVRERRWETDPGQYLSLAAIESIVMNEESAPAGNNEQLQKSLEEIPRVIACAKANLKKPPLLFLDQASETLDSMLVFFKKELRTYIAGRAAQHLALSAAYEKALAALEEYGRFLRRDLRPQARSTMGIGRELYNYYLKEKYLLDDDVDSLLKKGETYFTETILLLEQTARRIDPLKTWQELIAENRKSHPDLDSLLPSWEKEIQRARQHVLEKKLAIIPDGEMVRVIPMPPSGRKQSPFGVMDTPAPFSQSKVGSLIINPVEPGLPDAVKEELLSGHEYTFIATIAPHETYPGHHLHALKIQQNPRPLRKVIQSNLFGEGWGLYAEELMYETGFFKDAERTRLTQLRSRLWRAARVILDVKLQTDRISYEQARKFLEEKVLFEPSRSAGEVNMYIQSPTYFITYILGYYDIMSIRADYKKKLGAEFSLLDFHEAVLRTGSLPTSLLRKLILGAR